MVYVYAVDFNNKGYIYNVFVNGLDKDLIKSSLEKFSKSVKYIFARNDSLKDKGNRKIDGGTIVQCHFSKDVVRTIRKEKKDHTEDYMEAQRLVEESYAG